MCIYNKHHPCHSPLLCTLIMCHGYAPLTCTLAMYLRVYALLRGLHPGCVLIPCIVTIHYRQTPLPCTFIINTLFLLSCPWRWHPCQSPLLCTLIMYHGYAPLSCPLAMYLPVYALFCVLHPDCVLITRILAIHHRQSPLTLCFCCRTLVVLFICVYVALL